jgi:hypothetical protein
MNWFVFAGTEIQNVDTNSFFSKTTAIASFPSFQMLVSEPEKKESCQLRK